ncbi:putative prophage side tail fiber protein [Escherichia coli]|uniref:prophage tail fiber N-terminal domain-containing protein n=1 Tax=Escherichia coli TaxID=562 RepID=UPI000DA45DF2|nr:prophage tail fiber N-terminal domain-containing protein [Escherichia coli]SQJ81294.1 putative prophage side tail fiber protein [Escherichia coli]
MAAVKISGVLKDGAGKPIQNCTIQLKAKRNSTTVLVNTVASENPDEAGRYSMDVEYGQYSVTLLVEGFPPSHAGTITVYEGSRPGTLNDFLGAMTEDDVMPEALRRFEAMVEEVARNAEAASQSAAAAKKSETAAASSKNAAKTSETNAANSAQAAATSKTASANSATAAKKSETNAKNSETAAKTSETNAKSSQTAAKTSETNAKASETAAKNSQVAAAQSESAAAGSATSAAGSATAAANSQKAAKTSETNAKSSQTAAKTSETNAKASETAAKSSQEAAKTSETNAKASETAAANSAQASAASQTAAKASEDAAREYASQAAEPYKQVLQPLPDVWIPFNDSLDMITGFSPSYKKIVIGDDEITMPGDKIVKFKRASKATYINKSGVLTEAAIDEPRFERDGLLIEGQRTNLLINSTNPTKWNKSSNMILSASGVDDFGFQYAKFTLKPEMVGQISAINIVTVSGSKGFDVTGGEKYVTISCRVQSGTPNLRCRLRFENYDGSTYTFLGDAYLNTTDLSIDKTGGAANRITARAVKDEASKWIFFEATIKALDTENMIGGMVQYAPAKGVGTGADDYIYIATPQVEGGACASSFIITGASPVTRASDIVTVPISLNWCNPAISSLAEVNTNWDESPNKEGSARILNISTTGDTTEIADESYMYLGYTSLGARAIITNGKGTKIEYKSVIERPERKSIIGFRFTESRELCVVVNGNIGAKVVSPYKKHKYTGGFINIGGQSSSGNRHLFGHVRNLRIWHKALTDAQMGESI